MEQAQADKIAKKILELRAKAPGLDLKIKEKTLDEQLKYWKWQYFTDWIDRQNELEEAIAVLNTCKTAMGKLADQSDESRLGWALKDVDTFLDKYNR